MVCGSCVQKLALRLVRKHKIDWIDALCRATKGFERFEQRSIAEPLKVNEKASEKWKRIIYEGYNPDYGQNCSVGGTCACKPFVGGCLGVGNNCECSCPDPLPNSSYVSDTCEMDWICPHYPDCDCACSCLGACYYDCDEGFYWNGEACVEVSIAKRVFGDGLP